MQIYPESAIILRKIQKAHQIVLNLHRHPDLDCVGSTLALAMVLKKLGKKVTVISPHKPPENFSFLKGIEEVRIVNFSKFKFNVFDLFIVLDSSSWDVATNDLSFQPPHIPVIIIDHHKTNELNGVVRLVDIKACATGEIVYSLLTSWQSEISPTIATALFAAVAGDTVFFKYGNNADRIFSVASDLLSKGADRELIVRKVIDSYDISVAQFLGKILELMKIDQKGFVWSAVPYDEYERFKKPYGGRELTADLFFRSIKGTEFGIVLVETQKGMVSVSWRSKGKIDVSELAKKLGGGGHREAAGCTVKGEYKEVVEKVLRVARSY